MAHLQNRQKWAILAKVFKTGSKNMKRSDFFKLTQLFPVGEHNKGSERKF